jgi:carbon-monoxide dehydrogenase iron sulfur subunit
VRVEARAEFCRECHACVLGCSLYHEGKCSLALARLAVLKDMGRYEFNIVICQHCDPPECMLVCPTDAIQSDAQGIVTIDEQICTRCGVCATVCPYEAIFHNEAEDRYLKCDLCAGRARGPLCVELCPVGALVLVESQMGV